MDVWAKLEKQQNDRLKTNIAELKKMALMYEKFGMESQAAEINEILSDAEADLGHAPERAETNCSR